MSEPVLRLGVLRDVVAEVRNYLLCQEGDLRRLKKGDINEIQYIATHGHRLKELGEKLNGLKEIGE